MQNYKVTGNGNIESFISSAERQVKVSSLHSFFFSFTRSSLLPLFHLNPLNSVWLLLIVLLSVFKCFISLKSVQPKAADHVN